MAEAIEAGFCVVEVILDEEQRPLDYRFIEANPAFYRQTGLSDVIGRTAREAVPQLEQFWVETYGRVALTGESARFEEGSEAMGRWFDVHALRVGNPAARRVAILRRRIREDRHAGRNADEEGARLGLALAQKAENLPAVTERKTGGKIGKAGKREQQRHDALQHDAVPACLPASHSVLRFKRAKYGRGFCGRG